MSPSSWPQERRAPTADARLAGWRATATLRPSKGADKNLGSIFFSAPDFGTGERLETGEGGSLGTKDRGHLSSRPSHYGQDRMCTRGYVRRGVSRIGRAIYDVFLAGRHFLRFFLPPFFRVNFDGANVCTHTNPRLSISADDG